MEDYLGTSTCRVTQYLGILIIKEGHTHYLFILCCNLIREQVLRSAPAVITDLLDWMPWTHSTAHALIKNIHGIYMYHVPEEHLRVVARVGFT